MKLGSPPDSQRSSPRFARVLSPAPEPAHRAAYMRLGSGRGGRTKSEASPHLRLLSTSRSGSQSSGSCLGHTYRHTDASAASAASMEAGSVMSGPVALEQAFLGDFAMSPRKVGHRGADLEALAIHLKRTVVDRHRAHAEAESSGLYACDSDADIQASFAVDSLVDLADTAQQVSQLKEQLASMHSQVQRLVQAEIWSLAQCQGSSRADEIMTSEKLSEGAQRDRESPEKGNVRLRMPGSDLTHLQAEVQKMAETIHEQGCLSDALCAEVQQKFEEMEGRIDEGLVQMQEKIASCTNTVSIEIQRMLREGLEAMDARLSEQIQELGCRGSTFQLDVQGKIDKLFARKLAEESDARTQAVQVEAACKSFDERLLEHKDDMQLQLEEFQKRLDSAVGVMRQRQQEHKQQEHEQEQEANDEADEQRAQCERRLKRLPSGAAGVVTASGKMQRSTSSVNSSPSLRSSSRSSLSPMSPQHWQLRQLVALAMRGPEAEEKLEPPPEETQPANPEVGSALLSGALPHASDSVGPEHDGSPFSESLPHLPDSPPLPQHAQLRQLVDRTLSEPEAAEA